MKVTRSVFECSKLFERWEGLAYPVVPSCVFGLEFCEALHHAPCRFKPAQIVHSLINNVDSVPDRTSERCYLSDGSIGQNNLSDRGRLLNRRNLQ